MSPLDSHEPETRNQKPNLSIDLHQAALNAADSRLDVDLASRYIDFRTLKTDLGACSSIFRGAVIDTV